MKFLTRQEAADYFRVDPRTVERWLRSGKIVGYKLGNGQTSPWRIPMSEVKKFLAKYKV